MSELGPRAPSGLDLPTDPDLGPPPALDSAPPGSVLSPPPLDSALDPAEDRAADSALEPPPLDSEAGPGASPRAAPVLPPILERLAAPPLADPRLVPAALALAGLGLLALAVRPEGAVLVAAVVLAVAATALSAAAAGLVPGLDLRAPAGEARAPALLTPVSALVLGLAAAIEALVMLSGGPAASPLHPLIYLAAAAGAVLAPRSALALGVGGVVLVELARAGLGALEPLRLLVHLGLLAGALALGRLVLRLDDAVGRRSQQERLEATLARLAAEARALRLDVAPPVSGDPSEALEPDERRRLGGVLAAHAALEDLVAATREALGADASRLYLLDPDAHTLAPRIGAPRDADVDPALAVPAREGALGAALATEGVVRLAPRTPGARLGHPAEAQALAFVAAAVRDGPRAVGVLTAHRRRAEPFGEGDEAALLRLARVVGRSLEQERSLGRLDAAREAQDRFHGALERLSEARGEHAVAEALLDGAADLRPTDFSAVVRVEGEQLEVLVARAPRPRAAESLEGRAFKLADGGLVASAIKAGAPLGFEPREASSGRRVFAPEDPVEWSWARVWPLRHQGAPVAALVLGSAVPAGMPDLGERRALESLGRHAAAALDGARLMAAVQASAATDPLTGLANRRRLEAELDRALVRASRFGRPVSVLMVDADRFKSINDRFGHGTGDAVLQSLAAALAAEARRTDVVARWGGEELCVLLDETDAPGAMLVAERMRAAVEARSVPGPEGPVKVTVSIGVAARPTHGDTREILISEADHALYDAKARGRNRVEVAGGRVA